MAGMLKLGKRGGCSVCPIIERQGAEIIPFLQKCIKIIRISSHAVMLSKIGSTLAVFSQE